ncbi:YozE family protein [Cytobacillus sp. IB215665]|uniref:YozE family protein n=1 Tax=Cytobacillus sp. IB215665 TaxID=3097357 RepID=UPI002A13BF7D|nr:YozE family protein [Cytobacillus sp. IB215665]MDX8366257.1 YozE family protein [Cytobacillus sp. IB215665]
MKSFYHYLMTYREPKAKTDIGRFANNAYEDHGFPKNSFEYNEISTYLEMNGSYLASMSIFDTAWELYRAHEEH